jgi:hypothetical protein
MHGRVSREPEAGDEACSRGSSSAFISRSSQLLWVSRLNRSSQGDAGDATTLEGVKIRPVSRSLKLQLFGTTFTCATPLWLSRAERLRATKSAFGATAAAFFRSACAAAASFDNQFNTARLE